MKKAQNNKACTQKHKKAWRHKYSSVKTQINIHWEITKEYMDYGNRNDPYCQKKLMLHYGYMDRFIGMRFLWPHTHKNTYMTGHLSQCFKINKISMGGMLCMSACGFRMDIYCVKNRALNNDISFVWPQECKWTYNPNSGNVGTFFKFE